MTSTDEVVHLPPAFVARPGQEKALRKKGAPEALILLAGQSLKEVGCLEHTLLEDPDDPARLSIYGGVRGPRPDPSPVAAEVKGIFGRREHQKIHRSAEGGHAPSSHLPGTSRPQQVRSGTPAWV